MFETETVRIEMKYKTNEELKLIKKRTRSSTNWWHRVRFRYAKKELSKRQGGV